VPVPPASPAAADSGGVPPDTGQPSRESALAQAATTRRVLVSATVGTAIEWYDFYLYSTAAALVLGPLFFPTTGGAAPLAAFATYAAGFVARPLGGLVISHFGDRVGRKRMLVLTLLTMGSATFAIGILPTYSQIGIWAPILLVVLRILQGVGIGGEFGAAILLAFENAPPHRRGYFTSWPQVGYPLGFFTGLLAFTLVAALLPEPQLLSWGWRVPFLASILLIGVGLYIRLGLAETPEFAAVRRANQLAAAPLVEVVRTRPTQLIAGIAAALGHGIIVTIFTVYLLAYASQPGNGGSSLALTGLLIAAALQCLTVPLFGRLSDVTGRVPVLLGGYLVSALTIGAAFTWLATDNPILVSLTFILAMSVAHGAVYGTLAAFLAEQFTTRTRFTGLTATYQLGSTISSFGPLVAAATVAATSATWPVVVGFIAVVALAAACTVVLARTHPPQTGTHS
jgi:MFS transporter, MHS family, shikimate and dehydroshikimate transport protein